MKKLIAGVGGNPEQEESFETSRNVLVNGSETNTLVFHRRPAKKCHVKDQYFFRRIMMGFKAVQPIRQTWLIIMPRHDKIGGWRLYTVMDVVARTS